MRCRRRERVLSLASRRGSQEPERNEFYSATCSVIGALVRSRLPLYCQCNGGGKCRNCINTQLSSASQSPATTASIADVSLPSSVQTRWYQPQTLMQLSGSSTPGIKTYNENTDLPYVLNVTVFHYKVMCWMAVAHV